MAEVALVDPELQTLFGCTRKVSRHFNALLSDEGGGTDLVESIDDIVPDYRTMRQRWLQPGGDFLFPRDVNSAGLEAELGLPAARVRVESVRLHGPKSPLLDKLIFTFVEEDTEDEQKVGATILGLGLEDDLAGRSSHPSPHQDSLSPENSPGPQRSTSPHRSMSPRNSPLRSPSPHQSMSAGPRASRDFRGPILGPSRRSEIGGQDFPRQGSAVSLPDAVHSPPSSEASLAGHKMPTAESLATKEEEPSHPLSRQPYLSTKVTIDEKLSDLLEVSTKGSVLRASHNVPNILLMQTSESNCGQDADELDSKDADLDEADAQESTGGHRSARSLVPRGMLQKGSLKSEFTGSQREKEEGRREGDTPSLVPCTYLTYSVYFTSRFLIH
jgi:hypothetical protein